MDSFSKKSKQCITYHQNKIMIFIFLIQFNCNYFEYLNKFACLFFNNSTNYSSAKSWKYFCLFLCLLYFCSLFSYTSAFRIFCMLSILEMCVFYLFITCHKCVESLQLLKPFQVSLYAQFFLTKIFFVFIVMNMHMERNWGMKCYFSFAAGVEIQQKINKFSSTDHKKR